MHNVRCALALSAVLIGFAIPSTGWAKPGPAVVNPDKARQNPDFLIQGEYSTGEDAKEKWGVQVIALGDGKFDAVSYPGGLPGDGWNEKVKYQSSGSREGDTTTLRSRDPAITLTIRGGTMTVTDSGGTKLGELAKVDRKSDTLGKKAPQGGQQLFDGTSAEHFYTGSPQNMKPVELTEEGLLPQGIFTKDEFQSVKLHIEFRLPFVPQARGQGRGNSGCYVQGRYEVQMLDSFGLEGKQNECGGIYSIAAPRINMCYPPLSWQTYDIDFTAAEYKDGKKAKNARMSVWHNGVQIHDHVELTHATTAARLKEGPEPGPIFLQDHGNPVRYRNIWVMEKK